MPKIPFPWLVFNEKVKVNSVFLRDSTAVSDSVLLLFGGKISSGGMVSYLFLILLLLLWLGTEFSWLYYFLSILMVGWTPEDAGWLFRVLHET